MIVLIDDDGAGRFFAVVVDDVPRIRLGDRRLGIIGRVGKQLLVTRLHAGFRCRLQRRLHAAAEQQPDPDKSELPSRHISSPAASRGPRFHLPGNSAIAPPVLHKGGAAASQSSNLFRTSPHPPEAAAMLAQSGSLWEACTALRRPRPNVPAQQCLESPGCQGFRDEARQLRLPFRGTVCDAHGHPDFATIGSTRRRPLRRLVAPPLDSRVAAPLRRRDDEVWPRPEILRCGHGVDGSATPPEPPREPDT